MKYALVLLGLLSSGAQATTTQEELELKSKFAQALSLVVDSTNDVTQQSTAQGAPAYPQYNSVTSQGELDTEQVGSMLSDYGDGKITQQITLTIKTPAALILGEVSGIVYEMGLGLYEGVALPTEENQTKVCGIVKRGLDKRRTAAFYPGYPELHTVFKGYLNQFQSVSRILECPFPY